MRNICYIAAALIASFAFAPTATAQQDQGVVQVSAEKKAAGQAIQLAPSTEAGQNAEPQLKRVNRPVKANSTVQNDQTLQRSGIRKGADDKSASTTPAELPWGEHADAASYEAAKLAWIETHTDAYRTMVDQH